MAAHHPLPFLSAPPRLRLAVAVGLAFLSGAALADAGRIQFVQGDVQLQRPGQASRPAVKGEPLQEGDTLHTGPGSTAQLLMADEGRIAMRPDTQMRIDTYRFKGAEDGSEKGVFELIKGGFRTLTGVIGRTNKNNYVVKTPNATIGIRGTDHEPFFVANGTPGNGKIPPGTYNKVNEGETYIQTAAGRIDLVANEVGHVSTSAEKPVKLDKLPEFLRITPPPRRWGMEGRPPRAADGGDKLLVQSVDSGTATASVSTNLSVTTAPADDPALAVTTDQGVTLNATTTTAPALATYDQALQYFSSLIASSTTPSNWFYDASLISSVNTAMAGVESGLASSTGYTSGTATARLWATLAYGLIGGNTVSDPAALITQVNANLASAGYSLNIAPPGFGAVGVDRDTAMNPVLGAGGFAVGGSNNNIVVRDAAMNPVYFTGNDAYGTFSYDRLAAPLLTGSSGSTTLGSAGNTVKVNWGIYGSGATFTDNGTLRTPSHLAFMGAEGLTPIQNLPTLIPTSALSFNTVGGATTPIAETGTVGGSVGNLFVTLQTNGGVPQITNYALSVTDGRGAGWSANLTGPQSLYDFAKGATDNLTGTVSGAGTGSVTGRAQGFVVGPVTPVGLISSYQLHSGTAGVAGTVLSK